MCLVFILCFCVYLLLGDMMICLWVVLIVRLNRLLGFVVLMVDSEVFVLGKFGVMCL